MINIKLDNKLSITSDSNQYILREMKEGTKDGEKIEIYEAIGYFGTLSGALKEYIRKCLRESDATSIKELIELNARLEEKIDKLVKF